MATVIDALLVTLGLDSSAFKKGAKEVSKTQQALATQTRQEAKEREHLENKASEAQRARAKELERQDMRFAAQANSGGF